jgi:hypothetical protein
MIAHVTVTILNPDGTRALHAAREDEVPHYGTDINVTAQRALARVNELTNDALTSLGEQAVTLGVIDPGPPAAGGGGG